MARKKRIEKIRKNIKIRQKNGTEKENMWKKQNRLGKRKLITKTKKKNGTGKKKMEHAQKKTLHGSHGVTNMDADGQKLEVFTPFIQPSSY
jgi:hypothetical protein